MSSPNRVVGVSLVFITSLMAWGWSKQPVNTHVPTAALVSGNSDFAVHLYAKLSREAGNLLLSPYSISSCLAMAYAGTSGETAKQMATVLHFSGESQAVHAAFAALNKQILGEGKPLPYQIYLANALWSQKGVRLLPDFETIVKVNYGAELGETDFTVPVEACNSINAWVEKQTRGMIKEVVDPSSLDPRTRLALANAIYFKGKWTQPFDRTKTQNDQFMVTPRQKVVVPMMRKRADFGYLEGHTFQALELTYAGDALSMVVFLPREIGGLADFEKSLAAPNLAKWLTQLKRQLVDVTLPKFKVTKDFSLGAVLSQMGMPLAFDQGRADFSRMTDKREFCLSMVLHKAYADVDEEGTEAAAVTIVAGMTTAAPGSYEPPVPVFRADHPFFFVIRDKRSGSILFVGRMVNPS